jgi:F-type H+-transporting ATPase subunit alpha
VATLNQHERAPLAVEDQTVQIFAATNGFLDRLRIERVPEFLLGLTERMHSQHGDLRAKIAGGDWSEEVQSSTREAVDAFAKDFGYDLDEEGQPLDEEAPFADRPAAEGAVPQEPAPLEEAPAA